MSNICKVISEHKDEIINAFRDEAQRAIPAWASLMPGSENTLRKYLSLLGRTNPAELGQLGPDRRLLLESHFASRLRQGFEIAELNEELSILARAVASMCDALPASERPAPSEIFSFFTEVNAASLAISEMFYEHMAHEEQLDKRYSRLLQQIGSDVIGNRGGPLRDRFKELLTLIMQALNAHSAGLLLFDSHTHDLVSAVTTGVSNEELEKYAATLNPSSFPSLSTDEPLSYWEMYTAELQVSDAVRQTGIQSVLAVRLPAHYRLIGILYVSQADARRWSASEKRRLETLGEQLTLHLENAKLHVDLEDKVNGLNEEQDIREQFMRVLTHDLRGPLNVVKMAVFVLLNKTATYEQRHELLAKMDANIDRVDRMITDLLDVNRLRAKQRLVLHVDDCNLAEIAKEVIVELTLTHGQRFVLNADQAVHGIWSAEELRRAIWNLAINAVKYGSPDKPITIRVTQSKRAAQLSVHNYGSVISPSEQANLFKPFVRTTQAQKSGQTGWGLGLALVHGCAEAHGGTVTVKSAPDLGTTFTIHIPLDSRPYQEELHESA